MKKEDFINGTFLNKLNRQLDQLDFGGWGGAHNAYFTTSKFEQIDSMTRQRNGVGSTLQLIDRKIEVSAIRLQRSGWGSLEVFVHSAAKNHHGFGSEKKVLVKFKLPGDKKQREIHLYNSWDREDFKTNYDFDAISNLVMREELSEKHKKQLNGNWHLNRRVEKQYKELVTDHLYYMMSELERGCIDSNDSALLEKYGIDVKVIFPYSHNFTVNEASIDYLKQSKNGLGFEVGYQNISTYCSIPEVIKFEVKKTESKIVKLCDIGLEESGYYSHHDRMSIKKEDLEKVIKFRNSYNRKARREK